MVYLRYFNFKTGINPSLLSSFPTDGKYTGTQKLLLTRTRIFGDKIGGTEPSGVGPFRKLLKSRNMMRPHTYSLYEFRRYFPYLLDISEVQFHRKKKAQRIEERAKAKQRQQDAKSILVKRK